MSQCVTECYGLLQCADAISLRLVAHISKIISKISKNQLSNGFAYINKMAVELTLLRLVAVLAFSKVSILLYFLFKNYGVATIRRLLKIIGLFCNVPLKRNR